jgi:hypothetical protein
MRIDLDFDSEDKKDEMMRVNLYLKKAVYLKFKKFCEKKGKVVSKMIQQAMEIAIEKAEGDK